MYYLRTRSAVDPLKGLGVNTSKKKTPVVDVEPQKELIENNPIPTSNSLIGYFILGSAGLITTLEPQESIGDISRWCERVSSGIFREPVNALSNLGFMFIGLLIFWTLSKDKEGNENQFIGLTTISILYASVVIFLGPGSLLMHGTHSYWGQWIDNVSMVMFIILPWLLNIKHLARWTDKTFFATYVSIVISFSLLSWFFGTNMGINLDLFGLSIALWFISEILFRFWSPLLRSLIRICRLFRCCNFWNNAIGNIW